MEILATDDYLPYENLKQQCLSSLPVPEPFTLEKLKNLFATEIESVRQRERIRSITDLIDCLERRDFLSEFNIEPLQLLVSFYNGIEEKCDGNVATNSLNEAIKIYTPPVPELNFTNQYERERFLEEQQEMVTTTNDFCFVKKTSNVKYSNVPLHVQSQNQNQNKNQIKTSSNNNGGGGGGGGGGGVGEFVNQQQQQQLLSNRIPEIKKMLSYEIAKDWRKFGRELDITDPEMDRIETQHPRDISSRIYMLLQNFEDAQWAPNVDAGGGGKANGIEGKRGDPLIFLQLLCQALDRSRRKDLRKKVEKIISQQGN